MQMVKQGKTIVMIFAKPNHIPIFVIEKLRLLLALLTERKREFEALARKLKNRPLRRTVLELAQECNQYAHELLSQLEIITGQVIHPDEREHIEDTTMLSAEDDILQSCQLSEQKVIVAYRSILNEPLLDENLRNLLRNQRQGLTCAFMQIKLLNSTLRH